MSPPLKSSPITATMPDHWRVRTLGVTLFFFTALILSAVIWLQWQQYQWLDDIRIHVVDEIVGAQLLLIYQQGIWSVVLMGSLSLVLMVLIVLMMWQMRRQYFQNKKLHLMATELEHARNTAVEADRSKGDFLANMSHEVRTPFQGLLGMLNLLESKLVDHEQRDYLRNAYDSAEHLLGLINDILDISTLESGSLRLMPKAIHLPSVLNEVENLMALPAHEKGLSLSVKMETPQDGKIDPEWVMADPRRVRQIMFNLINNAIKFTGQGEITASMKRMAGSDDMFIFTVRDSGMGMDDDTLQHLFTRFYQADTSVRRRVGGSGLGLEISRNLARMMGGDISVTSELGKGSLFIVLLQLPPCERQEAFQETISNLTDNDPVIQRSLRILVAEDHPLNLKFMSLLLERMGHHTTLCHDGESAFNTLQKNFFDVVLLDYHMPIMDGLATSRAIRNLVHTSKTSLATPPHEVKILLITADGLNETRQKAMLAGVDAVLLKPVLEDDLRRAFHRCGVYQEHPSVETHSKTVSKPLLDEPCSLADAQDLPLIQTEHWQEVIKNLGQQDAQNMINELFAQNGTCRLLIEMLEWAVSQEGEMSDSEAKKINFTAHQLKGACLMLGFSQLANRAAILEDMGINSPQLINGAIFEDLRLCAQATHAAANQALLYI